MPENRRKYKKRRIDARYENALRNEKQDVLNPLIMLTN